MNREILRDKVWLMNNIFAAILKFSFYFSLPDHIYAELSNRLTIWQE